MVRWKYIMLPYGEYISESFAVSSDFDRYVAAIHITGLNIHSQRMDFYYSVSNDQQEWSEWKTFNEYSEELLNDYKLYQLYFRFKIVFSSEDLSKRPYFQSISINLEPYTLAENIGDITTKPKLWLTKKNSKGDIRLVNKMTGQEVIFKDIHLNEQIFMDCENEEIISSFQDSGIYRYDSHNDEWLELLVGENYLKGYGDFDLDLRYTGKLLQD
ncbi:hypothetical protein ABE073_03840 [Lederbergia citrisecunda]|uniref:hypothetical protein n=1 Tax=Lederbergia citrisecunda TaxID=2833583 RepID=UPI003D2C5000